MISELTPQPLRQLFDDILSELKIKKEGRKV